MSADDQRFVATGSASWCVHLNEDCQHLQDSETRRAGPREQEMMDECPWCFHDDRGGSTGTVERDCPRCETSVVARYLPEHLTRCNGGEQQ